MWENFFLEKLMENVFFSQKTLNKLLKKWLNIHSCSLFHFIRVEYGDGLALNPDGTLLLEFGWHEIRSKNEKALEIAKNMLADGVDINLIKKYSGLTQEQIQ